jgi:hypothetical protein
LSPPPSLAGRDPLLGPLRHPAPLRALSKTYIVGRGLDGERASLLNSSHTVLSVGRHMLEKTIRRISQFGEAVLNGFPLFDPLAGFALGSGEQRLEILREIGHGVRWDFKGLLRKLSRHAGLLVLCQICD